MCILLQFLKLNKISRIKCIVIIHLRNLFPHLLLHPPQPQLREKKLLGPLLQVSMLGDCLQGS